MFGDPLFHHIGRIGGDDGGRSGDQAHAEPDSRPADDRAERHFQILKRGEEVAKPRDDNALLQLVNRLVDVGEDLGDPEEPDGNGDELDPAEQIGGVEGEAVFPRDGIKADRADDEPDDGHHQGLDQRPPGHVA
ncbi:MAG: hypothetical protein IH628_09905, partial [Proteobacteria bacterium]|nr:hypothetical protein [Pseudomonadota bacterium]